MAASIGPDRSVDVIGELIGSWKAGRPPAHLSAGRPAALGPVLFSQVAQSIQLAEGVLALHRAGHTVPTAPLVRQIIEFSIRAVWLERYPENVTAVIADGQRQRRNIDELALRQGLGESADTMDVLADAAIFREPLGTSGRSFQRICEELEGGDSAYLLYRIASNYTHASLQLTDLYVEASSEVDSGVAFRTDPALPAAEQWLVAAACFLIMACLAWERVDAVRMHRSRLKELAREFGVSGTRPDMTNKGFVAWQKTNGRRRAHKTAR